jgi:hypothetical protein
MYRQYVPCHCSLFAQTEEESVVALKKKTASHKLEALTVRKKMKSWKKFIEAPLCTKHQTLCY